MPIFVDGLTTYSELKGYKIRSEMEIRNGELFCNTIKLNINKYDPDYPKAIKMIIASETNANGVIFTDTFVEGDIVKVNFDLDAEPRVSTLVTMQKKEQ